MYIFDCLKNLFKWNKIGVIGWLLFNMSIIIAVFSKGFQNLTGAIIGAVLYILFLYVVFSPFGELILRLQTGCKKITDTDDLARIEPVFKEIYAKAKKKTPELNDGIGLFVSDSEDAKAFACGRKTLCITKGLLKCSDDHIKAVLAREFAHFAHKDADIILVILAGNFLLSAFLIVIRLCVSIIALIVHLFVMLIHDGLGRFISGLIRGVVNVILSLITYIWSKLGVWFCMSFNRKREHMADIYVRSLD